ncbi:MAG: hypothetical protein K6F05_07120, partial [Succinivibrio sp.]|nr:hypothetical protein [Succinivibrio sp.]
MTKNLHLRRYRNHSSYGLLMLPKTNTEDYKSFDRCVGECIASYVDFPSYAKIKQVWDKQKHSELHVPDKVFNAENFMTSCRNYMLDLTHALCWPVAQLRGEEKSYLRG